MNCRLFVLIVFVAWPLVAQQTTGGLSGTVTDATGATLPGVTVEIAGPALQGTRIAVTESDGRYRVLHLPPGDHYSVLAKLDGFETRSVAGIHVYLGQEGTVNLTLRPALAQEITVSTESPLVDVTKTTTGLNITASQFASLPTTRSFQALSVMAPGVSLELAQRQPGRIGPFATSPAVGAATPPENNYIIEGLSTTETFSGMSGTSLTMNFVEEVQVLTGGYSAEFGRSTGGVFNVVTKSGGNEFHGDLFAYYQDAEWSENNIRRLFRGTNTRADGVESSDLGVSLGGPISRDKLWFFAAYDPTRRTTFLREFVDRSGLFVDEEHQFDNDTDFFAGKFTWSINPRNTLVATVFGDPTVKEGWLGGPRTDPPVALRRRETGGTNYIARYTGSLGSALVIEARAGRHQYEDNTHAITELGQTVPRQFDGPTGVSHGGWFAVLDDLAFRDSALLKLTSFLGSHELLAGIDGEQNKYDAGYNDHLFVFRGQRRINPTIGRQDLLDEFIHSETGFGRTDNLAAYLEDQWKVLPNLQLNLGLRYEIQKLDSGNDVHVTSGLDDRGQLNPRKVDALTLDDNWAPRIGIIWDPLKNGRSKIYGYAGRYFEAIPLLLNIFVMNGATEIQNRYYSTTRHTSDNWYNPTGSPLNADWILFQTINRGRDEAGSSNPLDENLESQYQDEFILGGEYQFAPAWSTGIRYVHRSIGRVIEDFSVLADPDDPLSYGDLYVVGNPGERNFGRSISKPKREYDAVELTLQRRRTTSWQVVSSFVYAKAHGDYEGLYLTTANSVAPNWTQFYDLPSFQLNSVGKLDADRPYQLKVHGSYTFPFNLTLSEAFIYSAGSSISALGPEIVVGYGNGIIFLLPRGSQGRTPDYWTLDLHADYVLPFLNQGGKGLSVIVDVFNATDNHEVLSVDQNYVYTGMPGFDQWEDESNLDPWGNPRFNPDLPASPYYKTPLVYQAPRYIQVGLKFTY